MRQLLIFCIMLFLMIAPAWYLITLQTPNFIIDNFDGGTENFMIGCFYSILLGTLFLAIRWFSVRSKNWDTPIDSSLNGLDTVFRYRNSKFNALSNDDLPAFGFPAITTCKPSRSNCP